MAISIPIALAVGCWLGWMVCNIRWVASANDGNPVNIKRKTYYVIDPTKRLNR